MIPPKDLKTKSHKKEVLLIILASLIEIQKARQVNQKTKGEKIIKNEFPQRGCSFVKSFIPSLKGWSKP